MSSSIFNTLLFTTMFAVPTYGMLGIPDNINFVAELYNTTNCSQPPMINLTLQQLCFKTNIINGYPECCYDIMKDITFFENPSIGNCLTTNMTNTNHIGVKYQCNMTHFKQFNKAETLSYIGIISLFLLAVVILCYFGYVVCSCNRRSYNRV